MNTRWYAFRRQHLFLAAGLTAGLLSVPAVVTDRVTSLPPPPPEVVVSEAPSIVDTRVIVHWVVVRESQESTEKVVSDRQVTVETVYVVTSPIDPPCRLRAVQEPVDACVP